jgi:hypothetical protein
MDSNLYKAKVIKLVKDIGWSNVCDMLDICPSKLSKDFFDDDPFLYLNLFSDLKISECVEIPDYVLFYYYDVDSYIIAYNKRNDLCYSNTHIVSFLNFGFNLYLNQPKLVVSEWLKKTFNAYFKQDGII